MPTGAHLRKDSPVYLAEVSKKAIIFHKKKEYWSPKKTVAELPELAKRKFQKALALLNRWHNSCPWLNGKPLRCQNLPGIFNRPVDFNLAEDVKKIKEAMTGQIPVPTGLMLLDDLATELGRCHDHVLWLHKRWRKTIGKPNRKPKIHWQKNENDQPVQRSFVSLTFATWARKRQTPATLQETELPLAVFAEENGKNRSTVLARLGEGDLKRLKDGQGIVREQRTVSKDLDLQSKYPKPESFTTKIEGEEETLLPRVLAMKEFPHIPDHVYYTYPNRPCPLIGGEILIAPKTLWPNGYRHKNEPQPRGFLKSQLDKFPNMVANRVNSLRNLELAPNRLKSKASPPSPAPAASQVIPTSQPAPKVPATAERPAQRKRPAQEKHRTWKQWHDQGMSYEVIRMKWQDEKGEELTREAIIKGIKRA